jgi:2-aminoethylphosphonate-pyruvate transaminase
MQAVILAAGMGTRIRPHHTLPKGFIELGEKPIIVHSVEKLRKVGISDILIITGYGRAFYDNLSAQYSETSTLWNEQFSTWSSLYSLYCARNWIKEDFLLLESDIFYEERALSAICDTPHKDVVLVSGITHSDDEVWVEAGEGRLSNMSKKRSDLCEDKIIGEFVGINKLTIESYRALIALSEADAPLLQQGHYEEDGLITLADQRSLHCLTIPDLLWCEIDHLSHLERARKLYEKTNSPKLLNLT